MAETYSWAHPQRQPASAMIIVVFRSFVSLIKMLWPALLAIFFSQRKEGKAEKWLIISAIAVAAGLVYAVTEYFFFRFFITGNELVVKKGFFNKREIVLPLSRIQAVHLDQDWLHRLLNIVKVSVDSPGASNAEVKFSLKRETAEAFRKYILEESGHHEEVAVREAAAETVPVISLSGRDLLKLGISANFLKAFFILLAFFISVLDNLEGVTGKKSSEWMQWAGDQASQSSATALAMIGIMVLLVSVVASFVMVVLKYGDFRMEKIRNGFHIKTGLLNRKEKFVPFQKVQYISWKANWIRRHIPYYLLQFHAKGERESKEKWDISVPVTRLSFFEPLLQHYHPMLQEGISFVKVHPSFVSRRILVGFIICVALFLVLWLPFEKYALWAFLPLPFTALSSWLFQKKYNARLGEEAIQVNKEIFGKGSILLRWDKVQSVAVSQSIFQRRKNLATLKLFTASGVVVVPFIFLQEANALRDYALFKVETHFLSNRGMN